MKTGFGLWIAIVGFVALAGCGGSGGSSKKTPQVDVSKFLLAQEPAGAKGVKEIRESAKDQDEIAVIGRIGGMAIPWVDNVAAFSIVDPEMKSCSDMGDDHCPKPWDYC